MKLLLKDSEYEMKKLKIDSKKMAIEMLKKNRDSEWFIKNSKWKKYFIWNRKRN